VLISQLGSHVPEKLNCIMRRTLHVLSILRRRTEKERFELVHAGVGKEQGRIVDGDAGTALPEAVTMFLHEKLNEGTADLLHRPL
jgi:hypothetical protein